MNDSNFEALCNLGKDQEGLIWKIENCKHSDFETKQGWNKAGEYEVKFYCKSCNSYIDSRIIPHKYFQKSRQR